MRKLIVITIRDYSEMAAICVRSLRGVGAFTGTIVVVAPRMDDHLQSIADRAWIFLHAFTTHARLDRLMSIHPKGILAGMLESHDVVLGLDADIIATAPIDLLFDVSCGVRYQEERWQTYGDLSPGHPQDMYVSAMSADERERVAGMHPINIGHFAAPTALCGDLWLRWHALARPLSDRDVHGADQAGFNAIIRSRAVPSAPWHPYLVGNACMTPRDQWNLYRLLHFAGYGGRLQVMRDLERAQAKEVPPRASEMGWIAVP